ncbi:MAG TPA: hypothetical protein VM050_04680 [Patescibacteria group bacterium]|nr:hypothetical protein [Patescibacteria group bacterium]
MEESVIREGARRSQSVLSLVGGRDDASSVFEEEVVTAFVDKLKVGIDVPNYPQFRDMNEMYFEKIRGIEKQQGGYMAMETPTAKSGSSIEEVDVLKSNASRIMDLSGVDRVRVKACVTGPYTLASFFNLKTPGLFEGLGSALAEITSRSLFNNRRGELALLCIDEPVLGFLNDPMLDYGSDGREALIRAWDKICRTASSKGVETSMHLHNTSDDVYWNVEHLDMLESHVVDPLYSQNATKRRLEETDKRLKASISVTIFDTLIENHLRASGVEKEVQQKVGDTWTEINHGRLDPFIFMEEQSLLLRRLEGIVEKFGEERVPYAGPECGMSSWPTYETAMEGLRRTSGAVQQLNERGA